VATDAHTAKNSDAQTPTTMHGLGEKSSKSRRAAKKQNYFMQMIGATTIPSSIGDNEKGGIFGMSHNLGDEAIAPSMFTPNTN
jgi:hypothetical protein